MTTTTSYNYAIIFTIVSSIQVIFVNVITHNECLKASVTVINFDNNASVLAQDTIIEKIDDVNRTKQLSILDHDKQKHVVLQLQDRILVIMM